MCVDALGRFGMGICVSREDSECIRVIDERW
jgi:hypothetical protein